MSASVPGTVWPIGTTRTFETDVAAGAGGTQDVATPLTMAFSRVTTVASDGDSVALPPAVGGQLMAVVNTHATNSVNVWPAIGTADTIDGGADDNIPATRAHQFASFGPGLWHVVATTA
ncbi:MAG TPA: hypothetical protein VGI78_10685 [Acetobacteraceae bacterium]